MIKLSVLMITKDAEALLDKSLESVTSIAEEIVIIDSHSKDKTKEIAKKYNAKFHVFDDFDLGKKRAFGLSLVKNEWVLSLDSDEILSKKLCSEISNILSQKTNYHGFLIPYQNHFLDKKIKYGGESYTAMRLFRKSKVNIEPSLLHEKFTLNSNVGNLNNKIYHYSYRSIFQMYQKFTKYALRDAVSKNSFGENTSAKKIFMYPAHMFLSRFITDKGYKDGFFRLPLDIGFAYMEFLTYLSMLFIKKK